MTTLSLTGQLKLLRIAGRVMQQSMVMADGASKSYVDKKLQESKRLERAHQVTK